MVSERQFLLRFCTIESTGSVYQLTFCLQVLKHIVFLLYITLRFHTCGDPVHQPIINSIKETRQSAAWSDYATQEMSFKDTAVYR